MPTSAESASPEIVTVPYTGMLSQPIPSTRMTAAIIRLRLSPKFQALIYDDTHTDGRDHSVQYDGNTADDRARDARDDCSDLSENTEQDRKDCCNTDDGRVIVLCNCKDAGVLTIGRIGRSAKKSC